jgi:hypothetical protein
MKMAAKTCLLGEIQIMSLTTCTADMRLARLAIDLVVLDIDTNETLYV